MEEQREVEREVSIHTTTTKQQRQLQRYAAVHVGRVREKACKGVRTSTGEQKNQNYEKRVCDIMGGKGWMLAVSVFFLFMFNPSRGGPLFHAS